MRYSLSLPGRQGLKGTGRSLFGINCGGVAIHSGSAQADVEWIGTYLPNSNPTLRLTVHGSGTQLAATLNNQITPFCLRTKLTNGAHTPLERGGQDKSGHRNKATDPAALTFCQEQTEGQVRTPKEPNPLYLPES